MSFKEKALKERKLVSGSSSIYASLYWGQGPLLLQLSSNEQIIDPTQHNFKLTNTVCSSAITPYGDKLKPFFMLDPAYSYTLTQNGREVWRYGEPAKQGGPANILSEEERMAQWGRIADFMEKNPPKLDDIALPPSNTTGAPQVVEVTFEQLGMEWPEGTTQY